MLATAVILFREVLEAALVISILLGASRDIPGRSRWVAGGIGLGLLGALIVAALATRAASFFTGDGQAMLNAVVLLCAVAMLTWHNVWMSAHGRQLAHEIKSAGAEINTGQRPATALLLIPFAAVMREGTETILFLWAIAADGEHRFSMMLGGLAGATGGILVGMLLYRGLLRIPGRYFFTVTSWLILLLASGLAAQAAGFLNQVGVLPAWGNGIWNTSAMLSQSSLPGQLLHILIGYIARPSGIEITFYLGTLMTTWLLMQTVGRASGKAVSLV